MDQFDLFNTAADTPFTAVDTPQPKVDHTAPEPVVAPSRDDKPVGQNPDGIFAFALKEARRMWAGPEHRRRSLEQLERFCRYQDNDDLDLSEITPDVVHDFIDHIAQPIIITPKDGTEKKKPGASEATQNRYTATLSKVMKTAKLRHKIAEAPSFHFYQEDTEARPRYYTVDEVAAIRAFFIERGDQWMADMVEVSCTTGLRRMEIVNMALRNIPLSPCGRLVIVTPRYSKNGKERTVPIEACADAVQRLMVSIPTMFSHRSFYRRWSLVKAELFPGDKHAVFHACRHTAATMMANNVQLPTVVIQKWLGHKDAKTTARYVHTDEQTLLNASNELAVHIKNIAQ